MKALIVDDSRTIRMMLKKLLVAQGFDTLVEAGDGREALDKLKQAGDVDLALVDWNMPVMNGFEFLTAAKQGGLFDHTRVMMVTTESEAANIARALEAGANEYIMKPFTPEGLREKLDILGFERPGA